MAMEPDEKIPLGLIYRNDRPAYEKQFAALAQGPWAEQATDSVMRGSPQLEKVTAWRGEPATTQTQGATWYLRMITANRALFRMRAVLSGLLCANMQRQHHVPGSASDLRRVATPGGKRQDPFL